MAGEVAACCLLNCSSHRVPESVFKALHGRGLGQVKVVSVPFELDFSPAAPPASTQVSRYLDRVATHPLRPFEEDGPHFLTVPGISVGAVLVAVGVAARLNTYPELIVVSRDARRNLYEFREFVRLTDFYKDERQHRALQNGVLRLE
jgi:hypothetical protein